MNIFQIIQFNDGNNIVKDEHRQAASGTWGPFQYRSYDSS